MPPIPPAAPAAPAGPVPGTVPVAPHFTLPPDRPGLGFRTLLMKEIKRFWNVLGQTVGAPALTTILYLLVFAQALAGRGSAYPGVSYTQFLLPGLVMMTVLQNAFANSSSSLIQSKVMGNLVFLQLSPLRPVDWFGAYVGAAVVRVSIVALAMLLVTLPFVRLPAAQPLYAVGIFLLAGFAMGALGLVAGLVSQKFDHIAAFTNFIITPMAFLAGVFYSVGRLPPFWKAVTHANPLFYFVDGFRYGFFGQADVAPGVTLAVAAAFAALTGGLAWGLLARGWKLTK